MLSSEVLANLIFVNLTNAGANGYNLSKFCNAIAIGIVLSIIGKPFTTDDIGLITSDGTGMGIGITGLSSITMQSTALSLMHSRGYNASKLMKAIMDATVDHLGAATLTSTDTPVFSGTGIIQVGTILVVANEMSNNIDSQLVSVGAAGKNRKELSTAIATAITTDIILSGTGTLSITSTSPPPFPIAGTGNGTGVIS